jgi:hypothetical protein
MTTIERTKDRQYNDHNKKDEGQTIPWPQCSSFLLWSLHCLSFVLFIVVIVLSVLRPFYSGHCIVCPSSFLLWSLYCLSFVLFIVVIRTDNTMTTMKLRRTDNAMTTIKRTKDRKYNDHNKKDEGQTIQWPQWKGRRTDNTMTSFFIVVIVLYVLRHFYCGHCMVCPSSILLWSLHCLSFFLFIVVIVLSVLRPFYCGHCIVCQKGRRTDNTMTIIKRTKDRPCNDHNKMDKGQTMQWPQ